MTTTPHRCQSANTALSNLIDQRGVEHAGVLAVQWRPYRSATPVGASRRCDDAFQVPDGVKRAAHLLRRRGIEWIIFRFHVPATACVRPAAETLHDHALDAAFTCGGKEKIGYNGAQRLLLAKVRSNLRRSDAPIKSVSSWHDHVRVRVTDRGMNRLSSSASATTGLAPSSRSKSAFSGVTRQSDHAVPAAYETWNNRRPTAPVAPATKIRMMSPRSRFVF